MDDSPSLLATPVSDIVGFGRMAGGVECGLPRKIQVGTKC
jgi:hypothetical protein